MIKPDYISLKSWVVAGLLSVTGLVAATTFLAPSQAAASSDLRSATISRKNYNEAMSSIDQQIKQEESDSSIRPECRTYTKTHGKRAAKAVLMIHGIRAAVTFTEIWQMNSTTKATTSTSHAYPSMATPTTNAMVRSLPKTLPPS